MYRRLSAHDAKSRAERDTFQPRVQQRYRRGSFDCTFLDGPASSDVNAQVSDGDDTGDDTMIVVIADAATKVALTGPFVTGRGSTESYSFTASDPGSETVSLVSRSCGVNGLLSNGSFTSATGSGSFDCTFRDGHGPFNRVVSVQIAASNGAGNVGNTALSVTVEPALVGGTTWFPVGSSDSSIGGISTASAAIAMGSWYIRRRRPGERP